MFKGIRKKPNFCVGNEKEIIGNPDERECSAGVLTKASSSVAQEIASVLMQRFKNNWNKYPHPSTQN